MAAKKHQNHSHSDAHKRSLSATVKKVVFWPFSFFGKMSLGRVVAIAGALAAVATLGVGLATLHNWPVVDTPHPSAEMMLEALADDDLELARAMALDIRQQDDNEPETLGITAFILGKAMKEEAEIESDYSERRTRYLLAARYFQEAEHHGVPENLIAELSYHLANCLYAADRWVESEPALKHALELNPPHKTELSRKMANALLRDPKGKMDEAIAYISAYLDDPLVSAADRQDAQLELGQIRLKLGDREGCRAVVSQIQDGAPEYPHALVLLGRIQLADGDDALRSAGPMPTADAMKQAAVHYEEALKTLELAADEAGSDAEAERQAEYLTGIALRKLGEFSRAEAHFHKNRRAFFSSDEGFACQLEEAEVQLVLQKYNEALRSFERLLTHIDDIQQFSNIWVSLDELRSRVERAFRSFRDAGHLDQAVELTHVFVGLFPEDFIVEMQADAHHVGADRQFEQARQSNVDRIAELETVGRREAREAARLLWRLAVLRSAAKEYPDLLWRSSQDFIRGQDYRHAIEVLTTFKESQPRKTHMPVLLALSEAELGLNHPDQALKYISEALQFFPKHPLTYRARLLAAAAKAEQGKTDEAKQLLLENLEHDNLTPSSLEWREALFDYGRLLYREAIDKETKSRIAGVDSEVPEQQKAGLKELEDARDLFQAAQRRMKEAIERYPNDSRSLEARYLVAESQRRMSALPRKRLPTVTIETSRVMLNRQMQQDLNVAVESYRNVIENFNRKIEGVGLTSVESSMLRNSYFAIADALYDLGRFDDAIRAYSTASNRYQTEPEALEAFVQIASCHRKMDRPVEAHGAIEQAKAVLQRIRPEAEFTKTTRHDRAEWQQLLDWLGTVYAS